MKLHLRATGCNLLYGITVLTVTRHKWTDLALNPARQASRRLIYLGGMVGWVDLGEWLMAYPHTECPLHIAYIKLIFSYCTFLKTIYRKSQP